MYTIKVFKGLPILFLPNEQSQILGVGKIRKPAICPICKNPILKGQTALRPITNQSNRSQRFCMNHLQQAESLEKDNQSEEKNDMPDVQ